MLAEEGVLDSPTAAVMGNIPRKVSDLCLDLDDLPLLFESLIATNMISAWLENSPALLAAV
jgi:hypothetical protein